jgi:DNA-binding transcriptional LysR family regulator
MEFLDPDLLRTFSIFAENGSLARTASIVGRSPSAVTAQMQRLETTVGEPLLAPVGRGRTLTLVGEELLGHARRILDLHNTALLSLKGARSEGRVRLAATQDFAESALPALLRQFAATHPKVRLELRIGRSGELAEVFERGETDICLAMRMERKSHEICVIREPMVWLASSDGLRTYDKELPLALLDPPCGFRVAALAALERAGLPFRIAATSQSLAGLRTAVSAGLAVTLRTARWIGAGISKSEEKLGLPEVGTAEFSVRLHPEASPSAQNLAQMMRDDLAI